MSFLPPFVVALIVFYNYPFPDFPFYKNEVSRQGTLPSALNPEVRGDFIQMGKNVPEQFFRHDRVTIPVRVG